MNPQQKPQYHGRTNKKNAPPPQQQPNQHHNGSSSARPPQQTRALSVGEAAAVQHTAAARSGQQQVPSRTNQLRALTHWRETKDKSTGKHYYYNRTTGMVQWGKPNEFANAEQIIDQANKKRAAAVAASSAAQPMGGPQDEARQGRYASPSVEEPHPRQNQLAAKQTAAESETRPAHHSHSASAIRSHKDTSPQHLSRSILIAPIFDSPQFIQDNQGTDVAANRQASPSKTVQAQSATFATTVTSPIWPSPSPQKQTDLGRSDFFSSLLAVADPSSWIAASQQQGNTAATAATAAASAAAGENKNGVGFNDTTGRNHGAVLEIMVEEEDRDEEEIMLPSKTRDQNQVVEKNLEQDKKPAAVQEPDLKPATSKESVSAAVDVEKSEVIATLDQDSKPGKEASKTSSDNTRVDDSMSAEQASSNVSLSLKKAEVDMTWDVGEVAEDLEKNPVLSKMALRQPAPATKGSVAAGSAQPSSCGAAASLDRNPMSDTGSAQGGASEDTPWQKQSNRSPSLSGVVKRGSASGEPEIGENHDVEVIESIIDQTLIEPETLPMNKKSESSKTSLSKKASRKDMGENLHASAITQRLWHSSESSSTATAKTKQGLSPPPGSSQPSPPKQTGEFASQADTSTKQGLSPPSGGPQPSPPKKTVEPTMVTVGGPSKKTPGLLSTTAVLGSNGVDTEDTSALDDLLNVAPTVPLRTTTKQMVPPPAGNSLPSLPKQNAGPTVPEGNATKHVLPRQTGSSQQSSTATTQGQKRQKVDASPKNHDKEEAHTDTSAEVLGQKIVSFSVDTGPQTSEDTETQDTSMSKPPGKKQRRRSTQTARTKENSRKKRTHDEEPVDLPVDEEFLGPSSKRRRRSSRAAAETAKVALTFVHGKARPAHTEDLPLSRRTRQARKVAASAATDDVEEEVPRKTPLRRTGRNWNRGAAQSAAAPESPEPLEERITLAKILETRDKVALSTIILQATFIVSETLDHFPLSWRSNDHIPVVKASLMQFARDVIVPSIEAFQEKDTKNVVPVILGTYLMLRELLVINASSIFDENSLLSGIEGDFESEQESDSFEPNTGMFTSSTLATSIITASLSKIKNGGLVDKFIRMADAYDDGEEAFAGLMDPLDPEQPGALPCGQKMDDEERELWQATYNVQNENHPIRLKQRLDQASIQQPLEGSAAVAQPNAVHITMAELRAE